jgi:hypothetical protein
MGSNNKLKKIADSQLKKSEELPRNLTLKEIALLSLSKDPIKERPHVNLAYYKPEFECFSSWTEEQLRAFSSFCTKISERKWNDIYKTGGSLGSKTGLGYTVHKNIDKLPENPALKEFSLDITWFELRVGQQARVHGFRLADAFFLVFLDAKHRIYS